MIDQHVSQIAPPPSLDDILNSDARRIGQVDFTHRLVSDEPAEEPTEEPTEEPVAAQPVAQPIAEPEPEPAPVAAQPTAEPEPAPLLDPPLLDLEEPVLDAPLPDELVWPRHPAIDLGATEDPAPLTEAVTLPQQPVAPPVAPPVPPITPAPAATPGDPGFLALVPEESELPDMGVNVEEIAQTVLTLIRDARAATQRHLAAVEAEAARRCEMVTAQAELDAELIRLHARREAHAILTAARSRTERPSARQQHDERRLHELGDVLSRFAEDLEAASDLEHDPDDIQP